MTALDACHAAHQAWLNTQPQYVLFDPYDVLRAEADSASPGLCSEGVGSHRWPLTAAALIPSAAQGHADTPCIRRGSTQPSPDPQGSADGCLAGHPHLLRVGKGRGESRDPGATEPSRGLAAHNLSSEETRG